MLSLKAEEEKPAHWSSSLSCSLSDRITKDTDRHLSLPASLPFLRWADMKRTHYRGVTAGEQITDARVWSPLPGASCDPKTGMGSVKALADVFNRHLQEAF